MITWRSALCRALAALCVTLLAQAAHAHLMPPGRGVVRVEQDAVFAIISIPVAAFTGWDADGNGRMQLKELNAKRAGLLAQAHELLAFRSNGKPGEVLLEDLLIPHVHDPRGPPDTDYVVAMLRLRWPAGHASLSLRVGARVFSGGAQLGLVVQRAGTARHLALTRAHRQVDLG